MLALSDAVTAGLLLVAVLVAAVPLGRDLAAYRRTVVRRRVIVNLKSGEALAGVIVEHRGPLLVLAEVELLSAEASPIRVDGGAVIERSNVSFVQVKPEDRG